jgi:hypothetical protein
MLKNDEVMVDEIAQVQVKFRNARDRTDAYYQKAAFLIDLLRNRPQGGKVIIFVQVCLNVVSVACASIASRTQRGPRHMEADNIDQQLRLSYFPTPVFTTEAVSCPGGFVF